MKYKTLFRLFLKLLGVYTVVSALPGLISGIGQAIYYFSNPPLYADLPGFLFYPLGTLLQVAFGLYFFFGGKWILDKMIPSNRPYCPECGYELTHNPSALCPECGVQLPPLAVKGPDRS